MQFFHRRRRLDSQQSLNSAATTGTPVPPQPDQAWKVLGITNEWVRHADTKTGVTLAFIGATAAALFNLVGTHEVWTVGLTLSTWGAVLAILGAIFNAVQALFPRLKVEGVSHARSDEHGEDDTVNLLFFGDVHRSYAHDRPTYREVLALLTADPTRLTGQVADQIHANAHIATTKYKWANRAIICELLAAVCVGAVAFLRAAGW